MLAHTNSGKGGMAFRGKRRAKRQPGREKKEKESRIFRAGFYSTIVFHLKTERENVQW